MIENEIYTSLEDAKVEIQKRWNDKDLRKKIEDFMGGNVPEFFNDGPRAILARSIATSDLEFFKFLELSKAVGMKPIIFEDAEDKFASLATDKVGLVKMSFFKGYDKKGDAVIMKKRIIDMTLYDGKKFSEIETLWGENLVEFHHRLLNKYSSEKVDIFCDIDWYKKHFKGDTAAIEYYKFLFAYFVCYGVQFENYITDDGEMDFFDKVVRPAYDSIVEIFGVKPLIIELAPRNEADEPYWWCYGQNIYDEEVKNLTNSD